MEDTKYLSHWISKFIGNEIMQLLFIFFLDVGEGLKAPTEQNYRGKPPHKSQPKDRDYKKKEDVETKWNKK